MPPTAPAAAPSGRASIRWRLILGVMGLLLAVLGLVGGALYTVMRGQLDADVQAELDRVAGEFEVLATEGVDPRTGERFHEPDALLRVMLERTVLAPTEGILGLVDTVDEDGTVTEFFERWTAPEGVTLRPEEDPHLVQHARALAAAGHVVDGVVTTAVTEYRYIIAPVRFAGSDLDGALVFVADMRAERAPLATMMRDYLGVSAAVLLLAGLIVGVWVRQLLRPIGTLRDTAARITDADLSERVPVKGDDELAALAATVNQMLDRIEAGVGAQRELLDDVGHELRTPVTVVRGHLELMDCDDPADVRASRAIALEELDRMGGLVTDLLTLGRAGQPDFLDRRPTNLAPLTDAVLTKARALGERRWVMSRVADVEADIDPDRITQAWLQLAANAVKYSEPDTAIQIGSRVSLGEAYLWVADQGMGIAADDLAVVRNRFFRVDGVRAQVEGSGLGLAIVDSIAAAHGGRLDIDSTPGTGSTFTIVIPVTRTEGAA